MNITEKSLSSQQTSGTHAPNQYLLFGGWGSQSLFRALDIQPFLHQIFLRETSMAPPPFPSTYLISHQVLSFSILFHVCPFPLLLLRSKHYYFSPRQSNSLFLLSSCCLPSCCLPLVSLLPSLPMYSVFSIPSQRVFSKIQI